MTVDENITLFLLQAEHNTQHSLRGRHITESQSSRYTTSAAFRWISETEKAFLQSP